MPPREMPSGPQATMRRPSAGTGPGRRALAMAAAAALSLLALLAVLGLQSPVALAVAAGGPGADRPGPGFERNRPDPVGEPGRPGPPGEREGPRPSGEPGDGRRPGRGGRFLDDVKTRIRASDEEWKVIGPQLRNLVLSWQMIEGGAGPGFGPRPGGFPEPGGPERGGGERRGGFDGPPPAGPESPGSAGAPALDMAPLIQAQVDLRAALDDPETSPDAIQETLAALREARQKARVDLAAATKELLELLTLDQEAVLVSLGYLD